MQILVIGMINAKVNAFTLLELLVVLLIIGILASLITIKRENGSFGAVDNPKIPTHIFHLLQTLQTLAVVNDQIYRVRLADHTWQVEIFHQDKGAWTAAPGSIQLPPALAQRDTLTLTGNNPKEKIHSILFYPSGFTTPFTLTIKSNEKQGSVSILNPENFITTHSGGSL